MMVNFAVVLGLLVTARLCYATGNGFQVMKHLNRFNKPSMKSIKSPDGDIIDCVHISNQAAFDHPSLKNHQIQMKPNFHPEGMNYESMKTSSEKQETIPQLWRLNGNCPKGTIPIRRTKKEDILRASSINKYGKKTSQSTVAHPTSVDLDLINQSGHQHAIAYVEGEFYGAKATMNVWDPQIQQSNEFSLSQIWLLGGSFASDLNSIEVGWQVSPDLYGDNHTRFFTYWTSDAYQATGCYNLLCSGFIQINNEIALGASISPISKYHGSQYDISILVWKDPEQGNWWMQFGNGKVLGYWPASLFSYLTDSASMIQWGGEVVNSASDGQHTTTQMGSGHFPEEGFGKSSYFRNVQIVDGSNSLRVPKDIQTFTEEPNCYDVQTGKNGAWGSYIFYGGPGRNQNCP
ncbi:uncharacterized protein LOC111890582 [Lactuca sativa]|uniref:Neprosin PEP catalytic domain-containing protein n=1 Tax=Lactuca sativa TaxID=4236 RepID=A0A9R1UZ24_LACSA|nr:uncharacterized protein LOC111890582 [Lactuca sativa]KAJ0196640.1 hypothetical protein LSAT_V11C700356110 [Lactuca sativa]